MTGSKLVRELIDRLPPPNVVASADSATLDDAKLLAVLGAARVAPSADNAQTWRFVTVRSSKTKARLTEAVAPGMVEAVSKHDVIVVVCGVQWVVTRARREQPFVFMDVPISLSHILLQAAELGLRCTWTLDVEERLVRNVLSIPDDVRVLALVGLS